MVGVAYIVAACLVLGYLTMVTNSSPTSPLQLSNEKTEMISTLKKVGCAPISKGKSFLDKRQQMQEILHSLSSSPPGKVQHIWPVKYDVSSSMFLTKLFIILGSFLLSDTSLQSSTLSTASPVRASALLLPHDHEEGITKSTACYLLLWAGQKHSGSSCSDVYTARYPSVDGVLPVH